MKRKKNMDYSEMEWQSGHYARRQIFELNIPQQFLLLCKLMDMTPEQLIIDFMDNLACGSWKRKSREKAKEFIIAYFIEHGYGQNHYSPEEIMQIFKEMDAVGMLFPNSCSSKMLDLHAQWRESYHKYWFQKWFRKHNRNL